MESDLFDIIIKNIQPSSGQNHKEEFNNCLIQIDRILKKMGLPLKNILKQTVFLYAEDNNYFKLIKSELIKVASEFFETESPSIGFIGQIPTGEHMVVVEFTILNKPTKTVELKKYNNFRYTVLNSSGGKYLFCSGISSSNLNSGIFEQSKEVFDNISKILFKENMDFSNIIRQWNYIENITGFDTKNKMAQNYQIFNNVRSYFYKKNNFINGYPSATGIGMNSGGVVIDFIASEFSKSIEVKPISSPIQYDAHKYSKEVLVGETGKNGSDIATPKFERAKFVQSDKKAMVFVSGTAAIDGQNTIKNSDVVSQTLNTINNIRKLISKKNLIEFKIFFESSSFTNFRVYIKNRGDFNVVKDIFEREFNSVDILYLISDICRENLLVEIEGILNIKLEAEDL